MYCNILMDATFFCYIYEIGTFRDALLAHVEEVRLRDFIPTSPHESLDRH